MAVKNVGTHITHCCLLHGCKYGYTLEVHGGTCPVEDGSEKQEYPCEYCESVSDITEQIADLQKELDFAKHLEAERAARR